MGSLCFAGSRESLKFRTRREKCVDSACVMTFLLIEMLLCALQINLRLILVSGKTKEFLFSPSDSAGDIAHHVFENWPEGELIIAVSKPRSRQSVPLALISLPLQCGISRI